MSNIPTYDHVRTLSVGFDSIFDSLMNNVSTAGSTYGTVSYTHLTLPTTPCV